MEPTQQTEPTRTMAHCYWHADVETGLSCSRCQKPICPQCMVQAPVGIRCKECGKAARMPTFDVTPTHYARAVAVAAGVAILGGIIWWATGLALLIIIPGSFSVLLASLFAVPLGYAGGDLISRSVNRKRSTGLAWLSGGAVVLAVVAGVELPILLQLPGGWFNPFFSLYGLLGVGVGVYLAVQRVRR